MSTELNVLLLEDNPSDARLVQVELRRAYPSARGTRVDTEAGFQEHLRADVDLILADYSLPQFTALRALDLVNERGLQIPFIVLTGTVSEEEVVECMKRGAADYLIKDR